MMPQSVSASQGHEVMPTGAFFNDQDYFGKGSNGVLIDLRNQLGALTDLVPMLVAKTGIAQGLLITGLVGLIPASLLWLCSTRASAPPGTGS